MVIKGAYHTTTKSFNMIYCSESISTWNISSSIVVSLPDCPLDLLSHCQEQKEVKEWGKDGVRFEAGICQSWLDIKIVVCVKDDDLVKSKGTQKNVQKRCSGTQRTTFIGRNNIIEC